MNIQRKVFYDCTKIMFSTLIFNILYETTSGIISIITADQMGKFSNSILAGDYNYVLTNIRYLIICLLLVILALPLLKLCLNINMFQQSLRHDYILYESFLKKNTHNLKNIEIGEIQYRLEDDAIDFRLYYLQIMSKVISLPVIVLYLVYKIKSYHFILIIIAFCIVSLQLCIPMLCRNIEAKYDLLEREYKTKARDYEIQITSRPYLIKLLKIGNKLCNESDKMFWNYFDKTRKKANTFFTIRDNVLVFLDTMIPILFIVGGLAMVSYNLTTVGNVVTMVGFLPIIKKCFQMVGYIAGKFRLFVNLLERLKIFYEDLEIDTGENIDSFKELVINNLSFSYDGETKVLDNMSLKIVRGDRVAIIGKNGTGKSTFIKIITGLENKYTGSLKINDYEMKEYSINSWRKQVSIAFQHPFIFDGTVEENVNIGNLSARREEVEKQIAAAGICAIKEKAINQGSIELSGGETQRISIARALLKDSPIIILDEPFNNLDQEGVNWLKDMIHETDKTILYITHDDTLLAYANKVLYL